VAELQQAGGQAMSLPGVRVFHGRAEAAQEELKRLGLKLRADVIVSRAFMPWPRLLPLAAELLAPPTGQGAGQGGGRLVVLANEPPPSAAALAETGGGFALEASQSYPASGRERYFWSLIPAMA
jgi:16S rRNA (guanine527-N7)-methyltransferase